MLHCPVDHAELSEHVVGEVAFATCCRCNGIWLPRRAREEVLDSQQIPHSSRAAGDAKRGAPKRYGCPRCKKSLATERIEGIEIDRCLQCDAIWLDAGEYDAVRRRIEVKKDASAAPRNRRLENDGPLGTAVDVVLTLIEVVFH